MKWLSTLCMTVGLWACDDVDPRTAYFQEFLEQDVTAFEVTTTAGQPIQIGDILQETPKPIVFNLWATWCPPCVKEMPDLAGLAQAGEFTVIALSVDRQASAVEKFIRQHGMNLQGMHIWHDPAGKTQKPIFGATQYPITYLIDTTGVTRRVYLGPRDWDHPAMVEKLHRDLSAKN